MLMGGWMGSLYSCRRLWDGYLGYVDGWDGGFDSVGWDYLSYWVSGKRRKGRRSADGDRTASGNMIFIEHTTDFEMFSSTSAGAVQGYGYTFHAGKFLNLCLRQETLADF